MPRSEHFSRRDDRTAPEPRRDGRLRSVYYKRRFVVAILISVVFYLSIIGLITSAIAFYFSKPEHARTSAMSLAVCLTICMSSWLVSYIKRRNTLCPHCRSTPFLDNMARKHELASRIRPLNYGTTAMLAAALTQRWRCMYCGHRFDLLKLPTGRHKK